MSHPLIQSYGRTLDYTFPLIVVIGREPNTNLPISLEHGLYNFDRYPNTGFWNNAYGLIGQTVSLTTGQLKQLCRERQSSPIVFADALPIGLKHAVTNKQRHRELAQERVHSHIDAIFGFRPIISRTAVVLMSGLAAGTFKDAVERIQSHCEQHTIPYCKLSFFFGNNMPKIRTEVDDLTRTRLRNAVTSFLHSAFS